ncbi:MAG: cellulase N-terminal Ig-like domain-containing protein [Ilumatobacteraceae bacterium]
MDRRIAVGLGVVGALAAGATGTWYVLRDDEPSVPPRTVTTLPPPTAPATTEAGVAGAVEFAIDDGATLSTDRTLTLSLQAPSDVTDVQVSTDPGFHAATWTPVAPSVEFEVPDVGYQMVFVRGRIGSGEPGPVRVAGIDVDEQWDAATASAGEGRHRPSYAQLLAPDVLQVRIETGRVTNDDGDKVVVGDDLVLGRLFETGGYVFGGPGGAGLTVLAANPITRPAGSIGYDPPYPVVHDWVLELSAPVPVGQEIELSFLDDVDPISFTIDPTSTRSPSVQVNQVGFAPGDGGKLAFVGAWGGWAGPIELPDGMAFRVIDDATDEVVLTGTTVARTPGPNGDWGKGDLTGTAVQAADFSSLTTEGRYRVCVDVLGCSPSFDIGVDDTWRRALVAAGRAMYHQRSGIALGPPYTSIVRPRPFHPDDGVQFERVTLTMLDRLDNVGVDDRFDEYPDAVTGELVPDVWGGHFDAGDWNMRIQHLSYLEAALDLVELFPEYFADLELGIPESGDAVPDVIDEGLWDLDLFRRLQSADGGVAGAVDQVSFANEGETSWDNGLRVFVYSPDVWSTYWYAAAAARTAIVLETYDPERAATYASSAQRAMDWAEQTWAADPARAERAAAVEPRRGGRHGDAATHRRRPLRPDLPRGIAVRHRDDAVARLPRPAVRRRLAVRPTARRPRHGHGATARDRQLRAARRCTGRRTAVIRLPVPHRTPRPAAHLGPRARRAPRDRDPASASAHRRRVVPHRCGARGVVQPRRQPARHLLRHRPRIGPGPFAAHRRHDERRPAGVARLVRVRPAQPALRRLGRLDRERAPAAQHPPRSARGAVALVVVRRQSLGADVGVHGGALAHLGAVDARRARRHRVELTAPSS